MSDIRIKTNARCIENYCNARLFQKDDPKEIRDVLRNILAHVAEILKVDDASAKPRYEIEEEIDALSPIAKDYDTDKQSSDTCLAAGAHDALRWALNLAENSISETLKSH